jgi:hypothetical protein
VLEVRPARAIRVNGRARANVVDENAREGSVLISLNIPIKCEREHSGCSTTATAVIPKAGTDPIGQTRCNQCLPAAVGQIHPLGVTRDRGEESKDLGVASRSVTPAVAVALDQLWSILRVRVRDKEAVLQRFVSANDVSGAR